MNRRKAAKQLRADGLQIASELPAQPIQQKLVASGHDQRTTFAAQTNSGVEPQAITLRPNPLGQSLPNCRNDVHLVPGHFLSHPSRTPTPYRDAIPT